MDDLQYIVEHVPQREILQQLSVDAAELACAAMKLRMAVETPNLATLLEACDNLVDKFADTTLLASLCLDDNQKKRVIGINEFTAARWRKRLEERNG